MQRRRTLQYPLGFAPVVSEEVRTPLEKLGVAPLKSGVKVDFSLAVTEGQACKPFIQRNSDPHFFDKTYLYSASKFAGEWRVALLRRAGCGYDDPPRNPILTSLRVDSVAHQDLICH